MRVPTCQLQHGFGADAQGVVPLPGWGGIDPAAGRIIESRHVLNGQTFTRS